MYEIAKSVSSEGICSWWALTSRRFNAHHEHIPSDETDLAISYINHNDFGWKADVCKLQKHHADYGAHCDNKNDSVMLA
jgi:hypothetical protein